MRNILQDQWSETHLPEIKSIVQEALIIMEYHWHYRIFKETPQGWLRQRLEVINEKVSIDNEKIKR